MPYAPGISYRGDQFVAQGNQAAWGAVGGLLQHYMAAGEKQKEEDKRLDQAGKAADAYFESLPPAEQTKLAPSPSRWYAGSTRNRASAMQGHAASLKVRETLEQLQNYAAQDAADKQFEAAFQLAGQPTPEEAEAVGHGAMPVTPRRIVDIVVAKHPGAIKSRQFGEVLRTLQDYGATPKVESFKGRDFLINPNGTVATELTPQASKIPEGFVALGATMDENGKLDIRYGPPKAEGKALTQSEVSGIASLNQAEQDLNTLENIYKGLGPDYGGPLAGRVKSMVMGGQNANIAALENAITAATPNLARGVFREVGVLTDQDVARYKQLLPSPYDTQEVRTRKVKQLRDRIGEGRKEMVTSLKAAGRDVEGFDAGAGKARQFDTESAARSAGAKAGDVIELYDPATATYRKARLK